jgi:multisubunit Na+/H+ antiporter MnhC subunit
MTVTASTWPLIGIAVSGGLILLLQDWRQTIPSLFINYICQALFLAQQEFLVPDLSIGAWGISTVVLVKFVAGVSVTTILTLTALTFSKEYGLEDLDEFGLAELRRAARAAQRQKAPRAFQPGEYVLAFWAMVLALLASLTLPRIYPIAPSPLIDFAWYWTGLTGLFTLATTRNLLKVGMGLLLCTSSIDLLYTAVVSGPQASGVSVGAVAMLSLVTILLALVVAYLSGLLFGRLKTLELNELYTR